MSKQIYKVSEKAPLGLFIRTEPITKDSSNTKKESTKIAILPMGHEVIKLSGSNISDWWQVSTKIQGSEINGFVNSKFLVAEDDFNEPQPIKSITGVHLRTADNVTRNNKMWAFPLNENNQPTRKSSDTVNNKNKALTDIVKC